MRLKVGLVSIASVVAIGCANEPPKSSPQATNYAGRTLLAVFAHPDDETMAGPLLAHYARAGARVVLVSVTSGEKGVMPHAGIPAGPELAAVREKEAACSASKLGAQPPVLLRFPDGGLGSSQALEQLGARLQTVITDIKPDAIVTWGPDGGYGHADHRLVSAALTQVVQSSGAPALYYAELPAERIGEANRSLNFPASFTGVAERFLTVRVPYTPEDAASARASLECHQSQFAPDMRAMISMLSERVNGGVQYLRGWAGSAPLHDILD